MLYMDDIEAHLPCIKFATNFHHFAKIAGHLQIEYTLTMFSHQNVWETLL